MIDDGRTPRTDLGGEVSEEGSYTSFAADYHWLLDDEQLTGRPFVAGYGLELGQLPVGAEVLDAACGIGVEAIELARRGFRVSACDASAAMVAETSRRMERAGLDVAVGRHRWQDLPQALSDRFALVVCNGNSLVHAVRRGEKVEEDLAAALSGLAGAVAPGGLLVIGSRNFELLRERRPVMEHARRTVQRGGTRCVASYRWELPTRWSEVHVAHVHLALIVGEVVEHRHHAVPFLPFRWSQFCEAVTRAGLAIERTYRTRSHDRYTAVLRVAAARG